jgi:hypothetical protein
MNSAILDTHHAIVGSSGGGKTVTAKGEVEQLLREHRHLAVIDPTGVWYGLRSTAGGDAPGFDIPIFGGPHGDVPIKPSDGDAIARLVIESSVSAIVDLSEIHDGADQRLFMAAFVKRLRHKPKGNFHLVVDEADEACPQTARDDVGFALTEDMIWIAKRGRAAGFVLTVITQRPADISKSVLSQMQTIVAHQLVDPRDQKAIGDYIKGKGGKATYDRVMASLDTLAVGERWIYSPRLGVLDCGLSPALTTFDSSRTPAPGEKHAEPKMLGQIDVTAIRAALAPPAKPVATDAAAAAIDAGAMHDRDGRIAALEAENADLRAQVAHLQGVEQECDRYSKGLQAIADLVDAIANGRKVDTLPASVGEPAPTPMAEVAPRPAASVAAPVAADRQLGAERKPLATLAGAAPAGLTDASWAVLAGFKRTGGTWSTYRSRLRTAGLIELCDKLWHATPAGIAAIGADVVAMPAPGPDLLALWSSRIPGVTRMLDVLGKRYPHFVTREGLASDLSMSPSGGTFGTYLSRLRANGLLEEKGKRLRISPSVMGDPANG